MTDGVRYRYHPLERRGLALGITPAQLVTLAVGVLVALASVRHAQGGTGLVVGLAGIGFSVALSFWPISGRTAVAWTPVVGRWLVRRSRRPPRWRPDRELAADGIALLPAPGGPGEDPIGVVRDRRSGTWSAVLAVSSVPFSLLDVHDKQRRLGAWGAVLASVARSGSPIQRLQWIERSRDGHPGALGDYLFEARADAGPQSGSSLRAAAAPAASYAEVIGRPGAVGPAHEVLVVVSVHPRRAGRQLRAFGRGPQAVCALLRRELRLLEGQLRNAEIRPGRPLDLPALVDAVRVGIDPDHRTPRRHGRTEVVGAPGPWPLAVDEGWASVHVDGRWHATYWIAEWPRIDVGPDFLAPLLAVSGTRTVSLTMAPVPPARAVREAESARTADLADAELRRRAGFLSTARHRREAEGAMHREAELADGHGDYRFCGYVSASAASPTALDSVCAELEQAAHQGHLDVRRLYGQQHEALSWVMPLGRGVS